MSVSGRRWKSAQRRHREDALKTSISYSQEEEKGLPFVPEFPYHLFPYSPEFFSGKSILEMGCRPTSAFHSLRQAFLRLGIYPLAGELAHFYRNGTSHKSLRTEERLCRRQAND